MLYRLRDDGALYLRHSGKRLAFSGIGDFVRLLRNRQIPIEIDGISLHLIGAVNCNDLALLNGVFRRNREQCTIEAILHAGDWLSVF